MDKHNGAGIKADLYGMCGILDFDLDDFLSKSKVKWCMEIKSGLARFALN